MQLTQVLGELSYRGLLFLYWIFGLSCGLGLENLPFSIFSCHVIYPLCIAIKFAAFISSKFFQFLEFLFSFETWIKKLRNWYFFLVSFTLFIHLHQGIKSSAPFPCPQCCPPYKIMSATTTNLFHYQVLMWTPRANPLFLEHPFPYYYIFTLPALPLSLLLYLHASIKAGSLLSFRMKLGEVWCIRLERNLINFMNNFLMLPLPACSWCWPSNS